MERGVTGRTPAGSHPARSNSFTKKGLSGREGVLSVDWKREVIGSVIPSGFLLNTLVFRAFSSSSSLKVFLLNV